jgi:hypothetical protein
MVNSLSRYGPKFQTFRNVRIVRLLIDVNFEQCGTANIFASYYLFKYVSGSKGEEDVCWMKIYDEQLQGVQLSLPLGRVHKSTGTVQTQTASNH